MRTVDRRFTFWMAGYYDDFLGAITLPDDLNEPAITYSSTKSHAGNSITGYAPLNPRHTHAWVEREDGATGRFRNSTLTNGAQYKVNAGIHEWLTYDQNRQSAGSYVGKSNLQYPDSITNANRQKYNAGADYATVVEGYIMFCNGYDTSGRYYSSIGTNDATFGRDTAGTPDNTTGGLNADLHATAGIPTNATTPTKHIRTHVAGVYSGEVPYSDAISNGTSYRYLYPIESPSGGNFLVTEIFTTSTSYDPVFAYDGTLNSKGDGDVFTIRLHACAVDTSSARIKLRIGCEGTAMTSTISGETTYTHAAIELEITPTTYQEATGTYTEPTLTSLWDDYDFVINYTAYTYDLYKNGVAVSTGNAMSNKADTTPFGASDMYGWALEAKNCSKKATVLVDRVGLIRPLNDHPNGAEMPPAGKMTWNSAVNSISSLNLTLTDDDAQLKLLSFFNESSYADWSLLMFRGDISRPLWRGFVTGLSYSQVASQSTPTITLSAQDSFKNLDHQIPVWELGQEGDASSTSTVAYNRSEAQNNINVYFFGASRLVSANKTLSFNEYEDGGGVFVKHTDSRLRNRTAHPIQMYVGEDERGGNDPYDDWDDAITAGHATSDAASRAIHSRWMKDIKDSLWFKHTFGRIDDRPLVSSTLAADFTKGSTTMSFLGAVDIADGGSIEIIDDNGKVDSGVYDSVSYSLDTTIARVVWDYTKTRLYQAYSNSYDHSFELILYVQKSLADFADLNSKTFTISGCTIITEANDTWEGVIDIFDPNILLGGTDCWKVKLKKNGQPKVFNAHRTNGSNPTEAPASVGNNYASIGQRAGIVKWEYNGNIKGGTATLTLPATNFFERNHSSGEIINIRNLSTDYKHIWVLWADMRNDGNANADAGLRRSEFGLMTPYATNYSLSLVYADENVDSENGRNEFVDLAIGQDVELWSMDAMADPITGNPWSAITGGSDSESDSKYHDWWSKAGSFVIIDTSKFFNLNTYSNGGKTGQIAGGRKEVGDYLVETEGFPVLIDNYWVEAPTTPFNLDDSASWNANYKYLLSKVTTLKNSVEQGDFLIQFNESIIPTSAIAPSTAFQIVSQEKSRIYHGRTNGKWPTSAVNSVAAVNDGAGVVKITVTGTDAKYFKVGDSITISNSTTTPTIDANYEVLKIDLASGQSYADYLYVGVAPTVTIGAGTVSITAEHTYWLNTLKFLGKPVPQTKTTGEWDGTGYDTTGTTPNNSADYLTTISALNKSDIALTILDPDDSNSGGFKDLQVYWGLANVFPMRLMMQLNGFIENPATMTFAEHDKFRVTWMDSLTRNWMEQSALYGIPNIATIPITKDMNTSQKKADDDGRAGYILSTTATSGSSVTVNTTDKTGNPAPHLLSTGDVVTITDNAQLANDSKVSYQQNYTIIAITATSFDITATGKTSTTSDGNWVKAGQIDTLGSVNDVRSSSISNIFTTTQATAGLSDKYAVRTPFAWLMGRDGKPSFRPSYGSGFVFNRNNLTVSSLSTQSGSQISNVRVFYNGGVSFVDYPSATLGNRPRWDILQMPEVTSAAEALKVAKQEYEKGKSAPLSITAKIQRFGDGNTMDGLNDTMLYNARYGYIADQSRTIPRSRIFSSSSFTEDKAWAWFSLWGGNLFGGATNALDGKIGNSMWLENDAATWDENYFWYGSHSLSYALQVVHIPHGMPKTTDKTPSSLRYNYDGKLRIAIDIDEDTDFGDADNARFHIYLIDYEWDNEFAGTRISHTRTLVDSNGYYELEIPSSYWAAQTGTERVLVSVNYEYLKSLIQERCGSSNLHLNAHDWTFTYSNGHNTNSIFPLGVRKWGYADYWNKRSEWYAPRLHIVDDINFTPATTVTYTDSVLELNLEPMQIRSISWSIDGANREDLSLTLERDMSRAAKGGFASYIVPKTPKSGTGFKGGGVSGSNTPVSGGGRSGLPNDGAWDGYGDWGDTPAGSLGNAKFAPITTPNRSFGTPDGLTSNTNSQFNIGAGNMAANLTNQIKGAMEFNNDSVTGGSFAVLGQKKPSAAPRNNDGAYGLNMSPSDGDAIMDGDGITFAGAVDNTSPYSAFNANVPVPPNVATPQIQISGIATMDATSGDAVIFVIASTLESGVLISKEVTISSNDKGSIVLFDDVVEGANINTNTLKVTIARQAGAGSDTAQYGSVTIHNLQVGFDTQSVSGKGQSSDFTF